MNKIEHPDIALPPAQLKEGQCYYNPRYKTTYILARVGVNKFGLIGLGSGDRWADAPKDSELDAFANSFTDFILVTKPFTITPQ